MDQYRDVIDQLKNQKPQAIVVFGSYAWGKPGKDSDLDVLVVKKSTKPRMERMREMRSKVKTNKPVDIISLTPDEACIYRKKYLFYKQIFEEGKLVYGKL